MSLLVTILFASYTAAPVPPAPPPDPLKVAQDSFQGEWKIVAAMKEGCPRPNEEIAEWKVVVKGDKMSISTGDTDTDEMATFTLDPKAALPAIDLFLQQEEKEAVMVKGIYKPEKDKLTICFAAEGADRPKEFKSEKGGKGGMFVLERVKK